MFAYYRTKTNFKKLLEIKQEKCTEIDSLKIRRLRFEGLMRCSCNRNNYTMFIIINRKELKMKSVHAELSTGGKPKIDFVGLSWLAKSASE